MAEDCPIWWKCCYTMKCIEDAADIGVVTAGGKIVVEFLDKTFEERKDKNNRTDRGICTDRIDRGTNKPSFEQ